MNEEIGRRAGAKNVRDTRMVSGETADRNRQEIYEFGPFRPEPAERKLTRCGEVVTLTPKVFDVLVMLVRNNGHLLDKDELIRSLWPDSFVEEGNLSNNIFMLRKALGNDNEYIETVPRRGYRFVGALRQLPNAEKPPSEPWEFQNEGPADRSPAGPVTVVVSSAAAQMDSASPSRRSAVKTRLAPAWLIGGIVLILLASGYWYLHRPLPPPRITTYTQITHDGRYKYLEATDGSRLYFTQLSPNMIAQVGVNGGEIAQLPLSIPGFFFQLSDISPDGSTALIASPEVGHSSDPQWVVPILGGAAKHLVDGIGAAFSPDGSSVIYSTRNGDIFIVRTDGTEKGKLASVGSVASRFRWSLDGKVIRFNKDGLLWEMSSDGTGPHLLLPDWKVRGGIWSGRWTQDGSFYVFMADGQIWALDERRGVFRRPSSVPIQMTSGPIRWRQPIPGRDGKAIFAGGRTLRGELSRIDLKTGSPQHFLGGISAEFVSFSPDGNYVAYVAFPEGTLWKANRDGGNRMQLTQPPDYAFNPRWSPDSKEIVFATESPDGHDSIRRVSADDGTPLWLMSGESANMHDPNWSPDGRKVLFAKSVGRGTTTEKGDLRIVDLETRQVTILPGSVGMWSPRWSPDGRYIAAREFTLTLSLFDYATRQWRTLPGDGGDMEFPNFSRDCRFIYFLRLGREQGVFRIPVTGGKVERVVNMTDWHLTGFIGFSMSLDPTDAPMVLRDVGSDDIYALTLERK